MSTVAEYTLSEMILLAAHKLEEQGQTPFSAEELIVASWRQFPRAFGLKGFAEQYPDSNRVLSAIMGEKGLARRGWLAKMGQKLYALSKDGRQEVRRMLDGEAEADLLADDEEEPELPRLPRDQERLLLSLLDSTAVEKYVGKRQDELNFADACRFWSITDNLSGDAVDARLDRVQDLVDRAEKIASKLGLMSDERELRPADIDALVSVHELMMDKFARHLMLLRNRR